MANRLQQLQEFYESDPQDPFNIYALALEYLKVDTQKARTLFDELLSLHSEYLPTYYHAAKFFVESGERELAIDTYEKGMAVAQKLNDQKALRELKSAYDELIFE